MKLMIYNCRSIIDVRSKLQKTHRTHFEKNIRSKFLNKDLNRRAFIPLKRCVQSDKRESELYPESFQKLSI